MPFMAIDLLKEEYFTGNVNRLYRHDLESCIWVLVYVLTKGVPGFACKEVWQTDDYNKCRREKNGLLWETQSIAVAEVNERT